MRHKYKCKYCGGTLERMNYYSNPNFSCFACKEKRNSYLRLLRKQKLQTLVDKHVDKNLKPDNVK